MGPAVEGTRRATIVAIPEHAAEGSEGTNAAGAGASATVLCSSEEPPVGGSVGLRIGKGGASSARFNKLMGEGFDHLSFRRYEEAITAFRSALEVRPFSTKAKILLLFADARHLVKKGKLDEARTRYEDILQLDPTNVTAQRDLVMLNCL
jgi:tetratricopeptide (TPR) repeat protein